MRGITNSQYIAGQYKPIHVLAHNSLLEVSIQTFRDLIRAVVLLNVRNRTKTESYRITRTHRKQTLKFQTHIQSWQVFKKKERRQ